MMGNQLSPSDFKERLRDISRVAGVDVVPAHRCWVESNIRCPYGNPSGTYQLRPESYCNRACIHFPPDLYTQQDYEEDSKEETTGAVENYFLEHRTSVSEQLHARAKEVPDQAEAGVLQLAADLIKEKNLDHKILLQEDLPNSSATP